MHSLRANVCCLGTMSRNLDISCLGCTGLPSWLASASIKRHGEREAMRQIAVCWGFQGYLFGGLHNKDYNILGSILGSPYFGKLPCVAS